MERNIFKIYKNFKNIVFGSVIVFLYYRSSKYE